MTFILCSVLSGCALMRLPTPTGKPDVTIATRNIARLRNVLFATMSQRGYALSQESGNRVVFTKEKEGSSLLERATLGNDVSFTPQMDIAFTLTPNAGTFDVSAHITITTHDSVGGVTHTHIDRGRAAHQLQGLLEQVKATVEASGQ